MTGPSIFRFTIRDLLWLTVVVAICCGWWLDRSKLVWSYGKARETIANLREKLDRADPLGQTEVQSMEDVWPAKNMRPEAGYALGTALFALASLLVVLVWKNRIHWTLFDQKW